MFSVIYEFDVIPGKESDFKKLWHDITLEVKAHNGGLGSRLHQVVGQETKWIAYAQWPSRDTWLNQAWPNLAPLTLSTTLAMLTKQMKATYHSMTTLLELEVIDDLLVPNVPTAL